MRVPFVKMHGLGNDFIVLDAREEPLAAPVDGALVVALANRHTGIGCDQLILLEAPSEAGRVACADMRMRIFNADGSEVEACGNATRAVGLLHRRAAVIETAGGIVDTVITPAGVRVSMGKPRFDWDAIPLGYAMDTLTMPVGWQNLEQPGAVNVGNPHVVFFVDDANAIPLDRLGPLIEHDPLFPERVNVNVVSIVSREHLRLRVWERGAGLTRACGTGACASAVLAMRRGLTGRQVKVSQPGGDLDIGWHEDGTIMMAGPAVESFRGSFDPSAYC